MWTPEKKRSEPDCSVKFIIISVTGEWVGVKFPGKKALYIILHNKLNGSQAVASALLEIYFVALTHKLPALLKIWQLHVKRYESDQLDRSLHKTLIKIR